MTASFQDSIRLGLTCKCPKCGKGDLYASVLSFDIVEECPECGLELSRNDSADGPAVFLIFILGFVVVPVALWVAMNVTWPLWFHTIVWSIVILAMTLGMLKPLKAYVIALQYKHRPDDWD